MDPGSAPQWVRQAHGANQLANFERHLWSAAATSRLPSPEQAEPGTMPPNNRLRLDDHQGIQNVRCNPIEAGKDEPIESVEGESLRRFSTQHIDLVAERQDLRLEIPWGGG